MLNFPVLVHYLISKYRVSFLVYPVLGNRHGLLQVFHSVIIILKREGYQRLWTVCFISIRDYGEWLSPWIPNSGVGWSWWKQFHIFNSANSYLLFFCTGGWNVHPALRFLLYGYKSRFPLVVFAICSVLWGLQDLDYWPALGSFALDVLFAKGYGLYTPASLSLHAT